MQAADGKAGIPLGFGPDLVRANNLWCVSNSFSLNTFFNDVTDTRSTSAVPDQPVLVVVKGHSNQSEQFRLWLNGVPQVLTQ